MLQTIEAILSRITLHFIRATCYLLCLSIQPTIANLVPNEAKNNLVGK